MCLLKLLSFYKAEREWDIYVYRERVYCGMTGGKRDQSASTCNFKPI